MWRRVLLSLFVLLRMAWPATGQPAANEARERDHEFLQCAMGLLYMGMLGEDQPVVRAFLYADGDPKHLLVEAHARRLLANMRFLKAIAKLDVDIAHGGNPFAENHIFAADDFAFAMLAGNWLIEGNTARLPPEERMGEAQQPPPPPLIKVNGIWKVNLTPVPAPRSAEELATRINRYAEVLEQVVAEITSGKFKNVEQISRALKQAPPLKSAGHLPDLVLTLP